MRSYLAAATAAAALTAAPTAAAQPEAGGRRAALERLAECRTILQQDARLACYDTAAADMEAAEARGDIVVLDREQARNMRRQAFGFSLPSMAVLNRGQPAEEVGTSTLQVESASRSLDGKWLFRLEGNQVWRQIDTAELSKNPKPGGTVVIKKAMLGSYKMTSGGASSIRVRREN